MGRIIAENVIAKGDNLNKLEFAIFGSFKLWKIKWHSNITLFFSELIKNDIYSFVEGKRKKIRRRFPLINCTQHFCLPQVVENYM